ncbi:PspA/IM30 family protein [Granulicella tundricola]|uniref:Phage shock protein A, PspA n=1 Tax=Granulicella tundricola (strain ATCC BAA-1859 / DSM 23138 / MP5ACTX9) TaxID=1198114 RepID=E8WVZ8_GRATM|nr:PspA/IM30 family protein [Granulicella tundricola]ADW70757.1 phage shock protein A, PspA [Granulicella tundricola MP5ACTX9]
MALLERVSTLLRANLNDLLDKAEDPEKLSKQIVLDMENQLLQVKTQVAVAIADQHRLGKQQQEHEAQAAEWRRKAELAVGKQQDDLARAALERSLSHQKLGEGFAQQHTDQTAEADTLRSAYSKLQGKLTETKARIELLLAQHRRNKALAKSDPGQALLSAGERAARLERLNATVAAGELTASTNRTVRAIAGSDTLEDRFQSLEQEDQIEALLLELKENHPRLSNGTN